MLDSGHDTDVGRCSNIGRPIEWTYILFTDVRWAIIREHFGAYRFDRHAQLRTYSVILAHGPTAQTSP